MYENILNSIAVFKNEIEAKKANDINYFIEIEREFIDNLELKVTIPIQLLNLYIEKGCGFLNSKINKEQFFLNRIMHPLDVIAVINHNYVGLTSEFEYEENTLPFLEVDVDFFLCLKPYSENPNAVHHMWGELMPNNGKICDSLVEFIERLVEDPNWFSQPTE